MAVTFAAAAEGRLAWGVRDRDWKPSTLSDNRSVVNDTCFRHSGSRGSRRSRPTTSSRGDELVDERGTSRRTVNTCPIVLGAISERAAKAHGLVKNPARERRPS